MIIQTVDSLEKALEYVQFHKLAIIPVHRYNDINIHINEIVAIYVYTFKEDFGFLIPLNHYESEFKSDDIIEILKSKLKPETNSFIYNKRYSFKYNFIPKSLLDIQLNSLFFNGDFINFDLNFDEFSYLKKNELYYVPLAKLFTKCDSFLRTIISNLVHEDSNYENYIMYDFMYFGVFNHIESNGIHLDMNQFQKHITKDIKSINDSTLHYSYNLYNVTSRPSSNNNGINIMALNKTSGIRSIVDSRFKDGFLVQFDFKSYHPHLIANLLKTKFNKKLNFYKLIAGFVKNINYDDVTPSQIDHFKKQTFYYLYGDTPKNTKVDFFNKLNDFKNYLYDFYSKNGYFLTFLYKRKIYLKGGSNKKIDKNLVFNYFVQSLETERNISRLYQIIKYMKENKIESKIILYLYDSILIDVNSSEDFSFLKKIKYILENNNYEVSTKIGKNYESLKKLNWEKDGKY